MFNGEVASSSSVVGIVVFLSFFNFFNVTRNLVKVQVKPSSFAASTVGIH